MDLVAYGFAQVPWVVPQDLETSASAYVSPNVVPKHMDNTGWMDASGFEGRKSKTQTL